MRLRTIYSSTIFIALAFLAQSVSIPIARSNSRPPVPSLAVGPLQAVTVGRRPKSPGCWPPDPGVVARRAAHGASHSNRAIRKSKSAVATTTAVANAFPDRGGGGYWGRSLPHGCHPELTMCANAFEPLTLRRLAKLANTQATRTLLAVAAFQWQKAGGKGSGTAKEPLALCVGSDTSELAI